MKCLSYLLYSLRAVGQRLWEVYSRVFGAMVDSRQQKFELEMAREARSNEFAMEFQKALNTGLVEFLLVLLVGCLLLSACQHSASSPVSPPSTQAYHSLQQQTLQERGGNEFLFGLISFQASQAPLVVTTGHIALFQATVVLPMIVGFTSHLEGVDDD